MIFYGQPSQHIIDYEKCKEVFCFDANGEFETDDLKRIEWIKKNKPFIRHEEIKIENASAQKPGTNETAKGNVMNCKKCDFTCSNKGELLAHYRKEHKKERDVHV